MSSKIAKGTILIIIGNGIFRIGGYIYRFLMAGLLGPSSYGILQATLSFQGIFQVLASGGIPPAIAKYISEYTALDEYALARQTIYTSLKIMIFLGLLSTLLIVFFVAPWLAYSFFDKPEYIYPLQAVGLITPFSVIVGAFRGAFQGAYKMEYILYTRAFEQFLIIIFSVALVIIGFSVVGAAFGSAIGFLGSAILSVIIFKKYMGKYIPKPDNEYKFTIKEELNLAKKIATFSIPVIITGLAEMGIFAISTFVLTRFLESNFVGYFGAADPISRFPLMISTSLATTILPATSASFAQKNFKQLQKYVLQAYKYSMIVIVPMCIGLALFSKQVLELVYFTNHDYTLGAGALSILVIGMSFYSMFAISSSIVQGIGNPKIPTYILAIGAIVTLILNWIMVPVYGIVGAAMATTIACFFLMVPMVYISLKLTKSSFPNIFFIKIILTSAIMGGVILLIPKTVFGLIVGLILCPIIYLISLILVKTFEFEDLESIKELSHKFGPLNKLVSKLIDLIEKFYEKSL
ncbi:MAG: flippase [Methanobrevibacter sp.]|jgi:stage V sporulation protein B|nr:flippase [Candidatus Methanovirga meridionalis]